LGSLFEAWENAGGKHFTSLLCDLLPPETVWLVHRTFISEGLTGMRHRQRVCLSLGWNLA
jgi:hypothetical protein